MKRPEVIPDKLQRLIPRVVDKGIYPRFYRLKDGTIALVWWVKVWKDGKPISQSSESARYSDALALKNKLIAQIQNGQRSGGKVDQVRIPEIIDEYLDNGCRAGPDTRKEYRYSAERFIKPLLKTVKAINLTTDRLIKYRNDRVAGILAKKKPKTSDERQSALKSANITVNRDFALIRAAMTYGTKRNPPTVVKVPYFPMVKEDNARQGFLENDLYMKLRDSFTDPAIRLLFVVGFNIGCRSGELRQFQWPMVDFTDGVIRLPGRITKNKKPRTVPIFDGDMMDALKAAKAYRDQYHPKSVWVFSRNGEFIKHFRGSWQSACTRAGSPELKFHDLRRTAIRNMTRIHGLTQAVAMKISGHLTDSVFKRYDIVDETDIKEAKRKVDTNRTAPQPAPTPAGNELLSKLAALPEEKLKAMLALAGSV